MAGLSLAQKLAEDVVNWRKNGYACADYPLIGEILAFQLEVAGDHPTLKFLRFMSMKNDTRQNSKWKLVKNNLKWGTSAIAQARLKELHNHHHPLEQLMFAGTE